jgi:serine/threonine protein kinase
MACRPKAVNDPLEMLRMIIQQNRQRVAIAPREGPKIEGYEIGIGDKLGRGGMGAVYRAKRKQDSKIVAIKIMLPEIAVNEKARQVFNREVDTLRQLRHKYIVEFIDDGSAGDIFYFVQEFCNGGSVDKLMEHHHGKLPLNIAGPIFLQVLEGLAYAHQAKINAVMKDGSRTERIGIVHRDLKPNNIFLTGSEGQWTAKIGDYGLATCFDRAGLKSHTVTGNVAGTPPFMPKEQVTNFKYVKPVSDIWSISATFYNMLTGNFPRDFRLGQDPIAVVLSGIIVPIRKRNANIPSKVAEVIDRALAVDVNERYQDAGEMLKAMQKAL